MTDHILGVDISKANLDVHLIPTGETQQFANSTVGFRRLIAWLRERPVSRVVYEPTGPWHRDFERALGKAGLPLSRVNPLQARRFAQALGQKAKTDAIDARILAAMGRVLDLPRSMPSSQWQTETPRTAYGPAGAHQGSNGNAEPPETGARPLAQASMRKPSAAYRAPTQSP